MMSDTIVIATILGVIAISTIRDIYLSDGGIININSIKVHHHHFHHHHSQRFYHTDDTTGTTNSSKNKNIYFFFVLCQCLVINIILLTKCFMDIVNSFPADPFEYGDDADEEDDDDEDFLNRIRAIEQHFLPMYRSSEASSQHIPSRIGSGDYKPGVHPLGETD
jgi:hypothetical protein